MVRSAAQRHVSNHGHGTQRYPYSTHSMRILYICRDAHRDDTVRIAHGFAALDLVDVLHAVDDGAPDRVLPVEKGCIVKADEELAIGGIRTLRARHGDGAAHVRLARKFGLELFARAAGASSGRISG